MNTRYDVDFYAWTQEQAKLLKARQWDAIDVENLIEEIETLGRQERRELRNRLAVLLGHLLKWQFQPEQPSRSWQATIREQRRKINDLMQESPSLPSSIADILSTAYEDGIDLAVQDTNLPDEIFPATCPYTLEQMLDRAFLPAKLV